MDIVVGSMHEWLKLRLFGNLQGVRKVSVRRAIDPYDESANRLAHELSEMRKDLRLTRGFTPDKELRLHASIPITVLHALDREYGVEEVNEMIRREHPIIQDFLVVRNKRCKTVNKPLNATLSEKSIL